MANERTQEVPNVDVNNEKNTTYMNGIINMDYLPNYTRIQV